MTHPHQLLHTQLSSHTTELGLMLSCLATHQLFRRRYPAPHGWPVRYILATQSPIDLLDVRVQSGRSVLLTSS
jgi:hypothetical protein